LRLEKALDLVDNLHLVKVLSAFFFQKQLHCITCWAYGDISTYYTVVKPRQVTNDEFALWFARQWEGVAHVLRVLEKQKDSYPTRIIPNRLLWFSPGSVEGSDKENGVIQLDVFGCYTSQLTTGMPLSSGGKPYYKRSSYLVERFQTYGAPEIDGRDRHLDFSVDVWGLGCILLEAVTWLLMGADALNSEFCQARENDPLCDNGNAFHGESHQSRRTPVRHHNRVVLPSVSQWIKQLHNHSQCTQYLHELLNLIEGRMLVVEPKSRIGLEELWTVLCGLTQNVKETPGYGSRPRKRGLLHNLLRK
jgi:hypothetical protein